MLVAVVTRFYDFMSLPLMHDEFSALFRARFDNLSDLIEYGVKVDGHPPLVQLYYYFMINHVSEAPWALKLPFILMGIASVYLLYIITKKEFGETAALISSSILSVSELGVMYSHLARPYASGLFFVLLFYWLALRLFSEKKDPYYRTSILFVLSGVFAAYNHHFSLLAVGIIGLFGLFRVEKSLRLRYMILGVCIAILYLPNLPVFFAQLELGGIGQWLSPPDYSFLPKFLGFTLNYNYAFYLTVFAISALSFTWLRDQNKSFKKIGFYLTIFFTAFLTGYLYSIKINPVLQYSVMIFFVPFLLVPITARIREQSVNVNLTLVLGILIIGIYSLIVTREYYKQNYSSPYISILDDCRSAQSNKNTPALIHSHYRITNYYLDKDKRPIHFRWSTSFKNEAEFDKYLLECVQTSNEFYFGAMSDVKPELFARIMHYYPQIVSQKNYFGATTYLFSKGKPSLNIIAAKNFDSKEHGKWSNFKQEFVIDSLSNKKYALKNQEWCISTEAQLNSILKHSNQFIDVSVDVYPENVSAEVVLVLLVVNGKENIQYKASSTKMFDTKDGIPVHLTSSIKLSDIKLEKDMIVKTYIWNPSKSNSLIDNYTMSLREGNPIIYGMFNPLP